MSDQEAPSIRIVTFSEKSPAKKEGSKKHCRCQSDICLCPCQYVTDCPCPSDPPHCSAQPVTCACMSHPPAPPCSCHEKAPPLPCPHHGCRTDTVVCPPHTIGAEAAESECSCDTDPPCIDICSCESDHGPCPCEAVSVPCPCQCVRQGPTDAAEREPNGKKSSARTFFKIAGEEDPEEPA